MAICSALNCSSNNEKGMRCFKFPADPARANIWLQNCRRGTSTWNPSPNSRLCEVHFDENQWERRRVDGWRKLKPNAIPTIFRFIDPPEKLKNEVSPCSASESPDRIDTRESSTVGPEARIVPPSNNVTISSVQQELAMLKEKLAKKDKELKAPSTNEEIGRLDQLSPWTETLIQGLKFKYNLGVQGCNFLQSKSYPLPSNSCLIERLKQFETEFGVFENLQEPFKRKVNSLDLSDRFCALSIDKIGINGTIDYHIAKDAYLGYVTLGDSEIVGSHCTVVLIKGVNCLWEQVIACEIVGPSTTEIHYKELIERCIRFAKNCGLEVISISSNVDSNNEAVWMWNALGVDVRYNELEHRSYFSVENEKVYVVPDVNHLLIQLMCAVRNSDIILPQSIIDAEGLPSSVISGTCIHHLWNLQVTKDEELSLLKHLKVEDIEPIVFRDTNLSSALRYFSVQTASALENAVKCELLSICALTTAFFCRLVHEWFCICTTKEYGTVIHANNRVAKFQVLHRVIDIFQHSKNNHGLALEKGMVMATLSLCSLTNRLLEEGFEFVSLGRFSQDAVEKVFAQVRTKAGALPSALGCITSVQSIAMTQLASKVEHCRVETSPCMYRQLQS